jgi:hypothetical protein
MPPPELVTIAEGDLPTGERWILTTGGTTENYYTLLKTIYADGSSDEGGLGGPALDQGSLLNSYTGTGTRGLRRVLARADPRVRCLRVELAGTHAHDLRPVAHPSIAGLVFFAALFPPTAVIMGLTGLGPGGEEMAA